MNTINGHKVFTLVPMGDLHYGSPTCLVDKFNSTLKYCKEHNYSVILMGDLFECATRYSVGAGVYEQKKNPQEQFDDLLEMLLPYRDLLIGAHSGNHEFRIAKAVGVDMMSILCKNLKIPHLGFQANSRIKVDKENYIVFSTHGTSHATLPYTKIKAVMDIAKWNLADLYLYAHVHTIESSSEEYWAYSSRNKTMEKRKRNFVLTGHFLSYTGSYAEMLNYAPGKSGVAKIKFFGDRHDIHVTT